MKRILALLVALSFCLRIGAQPSEIKMTFDQSFPIRPAPGEWRVSLDEYLAYRLAELSVVPGEGNSFLMKLYFHPDRPDLAQYDTPQIMRKRVRDMAGKYLASSREQEIELREIDLKNSYGYYWVLSRSDEAEDVSGFRGYRYMVKGIMRLTVDVSVGFSIFINDIESREYQDLFEYILSYVKGINTSSR